MSLNRPPWYDPYFCYDSARFHGFQAVYSVLRCWYRKWWVHFDHWSHKRQCCEYYFKNDALGIMGIFIILIKPDIILIDHGHFQYNSLVLGLIIFSIYFMLTGQSYICCFLFTIAINCKLMSTYYCLGFPCALIGLAMQKYRTKKIKVLR